MADQFQLTNRPIRVTGAVKQALQDALETSSYDEIDAVCTLDGIEGSTSGFAIRLLTGMQRETETGWVVLATFTPANLASVGASDIQNASTKVLKYVRYEVTGIGGATAIVFDIGGLLRRRR